MKAEHAVADLPVPPNGGATTEIVVRPDSALSLQDFKDVWAYRELLWILAMRDVSVRYKQAVLGVAWALLQPLTQMIIFSVLFNRFAGIHTGSDVPYPVFCFCGLTAWLLFSNTLTQSSDSLVANSNLITKVYFPRVIIPLATTVTAMVDFAIGFTMLLLLMLGFHVPFHASVLLALPIACVSALCAAALGMWTSAINLKYRDVRYALPFFIQILVYLTPVFYPPTIVPERYRSLLSINPMAAVIESFRAAMFGQAIPWARLGLSLGLALLVGTLGFIWFRQTERTFADRA